MTTQSEINLRKDIEQVVHPLETPISTDINKFPKTFVEKLFKDDFSADNKLQFNGTFNALHSQVKLNSILHNSFKDNQNSFKVVDDSELQTNLFGLRGKFKFSGSSIKHTLDLNKKYFSSQNNFLKKNIWINPYLEVTVGRNLNNNVFSFGLLSHLNNNWMRNCRFNFNQGEEKKCNLNTDVH